MSASQSKPTFCSYCGNPFHAEDHRERFCSARCKKLFATKHNLPLTEEFSLSEELLQLQLKLQQSPIPDETLTKEALFVFYDSVFSKLTRVVKWLNVQALENEKESSQENVNELKKKLNSVLEKAAELKRENSSLKKKLNTASNHDSILAKTLLGLDGHPNLTELKKQFKEKAKQVHPDVFQGDATFFIALQIAYELISDKVKTN